MAKINRNELTKEMIEGILGREVYHPAVLPARIFSTAFL